MADKPKPDVSGVTTFDSAKLKKIETQEKNTLPTKESECVASLAVVSSWLARLLYFV